MRRNEEGVGSSSSSSSSSGERYHTKKNAPDNSLCPSKWQPRVVTRAHLGADDVGAKPRQPSLHCSLRRGHQRGPRLHQPRQARPPFLEAVPDRPAARALRLGHDVRRGGVRVPQARRRPRRAPHLLLHRVQRRPLAARRRHRGVGGVVFGDVPRVGLPHLCGVCNCHLEKTSVHLLRMLCTHKSDLRSSTNLSRDKPNIQSRERWVIGEEAGEEANKKAQWEPLVDGR